MKTIGLILAGVAILACAGVAAQAGSRLMTDAMATTGGTQAIPVSVTTVPRDSVAEMLATNDDFSVMFELLDAAGLLSLLAQRDREWTLFVPTNAAFSTLPEGLLNSWLQPENRAVLTAIMGYHLIPGTVRMTEHDGRISVFASAEGSDIHIDGTGPDIVVSATAVMTALDLPAANGMIHTIDMVLVPPGY